MLPVALLISCPLHKAEYDSFCTRTAPSSVLPSSMRKATTASCLRLLACVINEVSFNTARSRTYIQIYIRRDLVRIREGLGDCIQTGLLVQTVWKAFTEGKFCQTVEDVKCFRQLISSWVHQYCGTQTMTLHCSGPVVVNGPLAHKVGNSAINADIWITTSLLIHYQVRPDRIFGADNEGTHHKTDCIW